MCGIGGIVAPRGVPAADLAQLCRAIEHRGPDGFGYALANASAARLWIESTPPESAGRGNTVGLAHRRLSILDLSVAAAQPMTSTDGRRILVYNGEIYNFAELRSELERSGHSFVSTGDTEVLLRAYEVWGTSCVSRFNGMWAFALLDLESATLFLSRDRFGIKPLYYAVHAGVLTFASEIKALLATSLVPRRPNERVGGRYLQTGLLDVDDETFYDGIRQLPAAHSAVVSLREGTPVVRPVRYWNFPRERFAGSPQDAIESFRGLLLDAVSVHARSDVPVGTCLSGGLDSSSLVCAAEVLRSQGSVPAYAHAAFGYVAAAGQFSERRHMEAVVRHTGVRMHYIECREEAFLDSLSAIVAAQDEPFGSASIAVQWLVFQRARQEGVKVMLDGQGADEVLGGYLHFLPTLGAHLLHRGELRAFMRLRSAHERNLGEFPIGWRSVLGALLPSSVTAVLRAARGAVAASAPVDAMPPGGVPLATARLAGTVRGESYGSPEDTLDDTLKRYVTSLCLPALLRYEDRNSMAHSLESRVPFLDYRLVELAFTLPWQMKVNGATTKHILREAMRGILPEAIRRRTDKIGFKATPSLTFDFATRHMASLASTETDIEADWIDPRAAAHLLQTRDHSPATEFQLWRLVNAKLWARRTAEGHALAGIP